MFVCSTVLCFIVLSVCIAGFHSQYSLCVTLPGIHYLRHCIHSAKWSIFEFWIGRDSDLFVYFWFITSSWLSKLCLIQLLHGLRNYWLLLLVWSFSHMYAMVCHVGFWLINMTWVGLLIPVRNTDSNVEMLMNDKSKPMCWALHCYKASVVYLHTIY